MYHVQLARNRHDQAAAAEEILTEEQGSSGLAPAQAESLRRLSQTSGPIHHKNLCVWCMKGNDEKHPTRDRFHLMQTMDACYAFKTFKSTFQLWENNLQNLSR